MKFLKISMLLFSLPFMLLAQNGGTSTYEFLNVAPSARVVALGGNNISIMDNDLSFAIENPALLTDSMSNKMMLNASRYMAKINYGNVMYARYFKGLGTFSLGIQTLNYGQMTLTDYTGVEQGTFTASDYVIQMIYSRALTPTIRAGVSLKPVMSFYESYNSFGLASDWGVNYYNRDYKLSLSIALKNAGAQIKTYTPDNQEDMPTDLQIGFTKRLAHAPFEFSITMQDLLDWDLSYEITNDQNGTAVQGGDDASDLSWGGNMMRHVVVGMQFIPTKNFYAMFGYNNRIRKELAIENKQGTTGFSWGFGMRIYKFRFTYGSARYHLGGSSNYFSLTTNFSDFIR